MRFIKLSYLSSGSSVYVNINTISTFQKLSGRDGSTLSINGLTRGEFGLELRWIDVNELPEQIIKLINEVK